MTSVLGFVANRVLGVEAFETNADGKTSLNAAALTGASVFGILMILFSLLVGFFVAFGAARQSYCYNMYIGNSSGVAFLFAVLCFFFPHFYYPFYALFLNPVCSIASSGTMSGGRRRH